MHASKIMIAVAALALGSAAFAAPTAGRVAISSGASATKGNLKVALTGLCTSAGGTLTEFTSGSNISTYVCADTAVTSGAGGTYVSKANTAFKNFAGTAFAELRLNVSGGSFTAVCALNNWPAGTACDTVNAGALPDKYLNPASGATEFPAAGQVVVGGLMDVAPDTWPTGVTTGLELPAADSTGVAQSFGVAVSNALYTKLFDAQKSSGGATIAKPIPSTCLVTDTAKLECVPTISKGQMATIMANNEFNAAYSNGVAFLTGDAADSSLVLEYNRRADTSGTQAAAQAYFLGLPCSTAQLTIVPAPAVGSSADIGMIKVYAHAGTGDVRARLNAAGAYGIGIISGENNQSAQGWKWLRLQGAAIGENATPASSGITNRASVTSGAYDFYFESKVAAGSAAGATDFWSAVTGSLNTLAAPVGLLNSSDLGTYNKGGAACQYNSSN